MQKWSILRLPPVHTARFRDWAISENFSCWIAEQYVNGEMLCVMPGWVFVKEDEWFEIRRRMPSQLQARAWKTQAPSRVPASLDALEMGEMTAALEAPPLPRQMLPGDHLVCHVGVFKTLGGEMLRAVGMRMVSMRMGDETVTLPKCFLHRADYD